MGTAAADNWAQALNVPESALDGVVPVVMTVGQLESIASFSAPPVGLEFREIALGVDADPESKSAINRGLRGAVTKCLR